MKIKIVAILLMSFLIGCSNDDDSSNEGGNCQSDIPFLAEGKTFKHKIISFGIDAGEIEFLVNGCQGDGFLLERSILYYSNNQTDVATDLWKQVGDFIEVDSNNDGNYFAKIYKKNSSLGEEWTHTKDDGTIVTHQVVSVDSTVTVPAGTFTCKVFKYTTSSTFNESFVFWHDEIGQIKEDSGGLFNTELLSYN